MQDVAVEEQGGGRGGLATPLLSGGHELEGQTEAIWQWLRGWVGPWGGAEQPCCGGALSLGELLGLVVADT